MHPIKYIFLLFTVISLNACSYHLVSTSTRASIPTMGFGLAPSLNRLNLLFFNVKANRKVFYNGDYIVNTDGQGNAKYTMYLNGPANLLIQLKNKSDTIVDSSQIKLNTLKDKVITINCTGNRKMMCQIVKIHEISI